MKAFGLVKAGFNALEPAFTQVFDFQPCPGVHDEAVNAVVIHGSNLPDKLFGVQIVVPAPEREGGIIAQVGMAQFLKQFAHIQILAISD